MSKDLEKVIFLSNISVFWKCYKLLIAFAKKRRKNRKLTKTVDRK